MKTCGRCGARYDGPGWGDLAPCGTMEAGEVRAIVVGLPSSSVVDLRQCSACGTVLARLVDRAS